MTTTYTPIIGPKPSWQVAVERQREATGSDAEFRAVCTELMREFPRLVSICQGYLWQKVGSRANRQDAEDIAHTAVLQTASQRCDDPMALFRHIAKARAVDFRRALRPSVSLDAGGRGDDARDGYDWLADDRAEDDYVALENRMASADMVRRLRSSRVLTALQLETAEAVAACDGDPRHAAMMLDVKYSAVTTRMHDARLAAKTRMPEAFGIL